MMLRVATAFSGGFGSVEFALKYLEIEHEVIFACEWMKQQRESYILNHGEPTSNFYEDICTLDGNKYKGEIDYYHLSPPCQEYSMAGNRGGADTDKGQLMFQAIKSIDEVQPKMFSVENVRGLLSSNNGEDWKNILKDFNSLKGYTISWGIMNAKEQGTPQNRERVFIVGFRGPGVKMSFPQRVPLQYVLKDLLEDEVDEKYFIKKDIYEYSDKSQGNKVADGEVFQTINAGTHGYSMGYVDLVQVGNIDTNGIAPTQNAKAKIRRLTPREASRVQGDFKNMFKFGKSSDTKLYEFIGNAMDINTTKNLIVRMMEHFKNVKLIEPQETSFQQSNVSKQCTLFDMEVS